MRLNYFWIFVIALVPVLSGCSTSDRQRVYPVRGTITFEGKAMPGGGSIAFVPLKRQAGKAAGGEIRENGTYELTTYDPGDGSMEGEFRVVIMQEVAREPREAPRDGEKIPEGALAGIMVAEEDRIPAVYADVANSPLKAVVEPKANNEINFDIQRVVEAPNQQPPGVAARARGNSTGMRPHRAAGLIPMATSVIGLQ